MNYEAPNTLPGGLRSLSHTSVSLFLECPEKWRRRYLENEYEPPQSYQVLGRAVHAAENQSYQTMVATGDPNPIEQVLQDFSDTLENENEENPGIVWKDESPGEMKDRGVGMLGEYHKVIVPSMLPTKVENKFSIKLHPDHKWTVNGLIDVIGAWDDGFIKLPSGPHDIKTVGKSAGQVELDASTQATLYTYATMEEGETDKPFRIHELRTLKNGPVATMMETTRSTEAQHNYLERIALVAREMEWRTSTGTWQGAPPKAWWCRATSCGYFTTCRFATR